MNYTAPMELCANCHEPISYFVGVEGEDWCVACARDCAVNCSHCGTLVDRNTTYEIGRWVLHAPAKGWEVAFVEPGCLIPWSLAERFNPVLEMMKGAGQ